MKKLLLFLMCNVLVWSAVAQSASYSYWFDADSIPAAESALSATEESLQIDASELGAGVHQIYFQVRGSDGTLSNICSAPFLNPVNLDGARAYVYVDGEPFSSVSVGEGNSGFELDGSGLGQGLHTMSAIVVCADGSASSMKESVFMRVPTATELRAMRCYYTIDNDSTTRVEGHFSGNLLVADIDASQLTDGLHSINFMLSSPEGLVTRLNNAWFMKLPLGGVNIRSYEYWVNDDMTNRHKVEVTDAPNPYTLAALLPLPEYPLRSSSFHFSVENGVPKVAPKHDFNILFTDNRGYFTIQSTPYFDPAHAVEITDITELEAGLHRISGIGDNEIRWYSVEAESGDSLGLKSSRACKYEMFAPDGSKLFEASGAKAIQGASTHTLQTGTHYIAVHDPAYLNSRLDITLTKVDKFALLDFTPEHFASRNFVIFDLTGNGMEGLKSVKLTGAETRECDTLATYDWNYARAAFFFMERPLANGQYDLTLTYADKDGSDYVIRRPVTIEDATEGELRVSVNTRSNTITNPRTISVTITNPTNVGLWDVPYCIARTSQSPYLQFDFDFYRAVSGDKYEQVYYDTDNLLGMGTSGRYVPMIIPYIGPGQRLVYNYTLERIPGNDFDFFAWCGKPWSEETFLLDQSNESTMRRASSRSEFNYNSLSQFQDGVGEFGGHTGNAGNMASTAANIAISTGGAIAGIIQGCDKAVDEAYNDPRVSGGADLSDLPDRRIPKGMTPAALAAGAGIIPSWWPDALNPFGPMCDGNAANAENSEPMPPSNPVKFPSSLDPNDILGYTSPGGTEHIGQNVRTLGYTIEFENDPVFATASALTVVVDNKIDSRVFDTASFRPVSLRIGKKTVNFDNENQNFVATIDMRPEINGVAQATVAYNAESGALKLTIESLSPYTMELSDDITQGFLPVNIDGEGIGEFSYSIDLRSGLADGQAIENKATIIFDTNEPIETPVWRNVLDYTLPQSRVVSATSDDNMTYRVAVESSDTGSGIWRYNLYMRQEGSLAWVLAKPNAEGDEITYTSATELVNPTFMTVATDRAGNVERNEISAAMPGDIDLSGRVDANDIVLLTGYYVGRDVNIALSLADLNGDGKIDAQDMVGVRRIYVNSAVHSRSRLIRNNK